MSGYIFIGIIGLFVGVGLCAVSAQMAEMAENAENAKHTTPEEDFTPVEEDYGEQEEAVYGKFNRN